MNKHYTLCAYKMEDGSNSRIGLFTMNSDNYAIVKYAMDHCVEHRLADEFVVDTHDWITFKLEKMEVYDKEGNVSNEYDF